MIEILLPLDSPLVKLEKLKIIAWVHDVEKNQIVLDEVYEYSSIVTNVATVDPVFFEKFNISFFGTKTVYDNGIKVVLVIYVPNSDHGKLLKYKLKYDVQYIQY